MLSTQRDSALSTQHSALKGETDVARIVVFDVNETLLDMAALAPEFARVFGDAGVRREWFLTLEEIWLVSIITDSYVEFGKLGRAALQMVAQQKGVELKAADEEAVLTAMRRLPAHRDVEEGLRLLKNAGFRLFALTNGALSTARAQLKHVRIDGYFEEILSADEVQRLKPAREPYALAAKRAGVEMREIRMVAAHAWDIAGAHAAGCATAFVTRPGKVLNPEGVVPEIEGADLVEVARKILQLDEAGAGGGTPLRAHPHRVPPE